MKTSDDQGVRSDLSQYARVTGLSKDLISKVHESENPQNQTQRESSKKIERGPTLMNRDLEELVQ